MVSVRSNSILEKSEIRSSLSLKLGWVQIAQVTKDMKKIEKLAGEYNMTNEDVLKLETEENRIISCTSNKIEFG